MLYSLVDLLNGAVVPLIVVVIVFCIIKKVSIKKFVLLIVFTLYIAEMIDIVGTPYIQVWSWNPILNLVPFSDLHNKGFDYWVVFQFVANIVLFIPFGILLPMIWKSFRKFYRTMIAGVLMSFIIEFVQLFSYRVTAVDDVFMNTLGTIIGYLIVAVILKKRWKRDNADAGISRKRDYVEILIIIGSVFLSAILLKYTISEFIYGLPVFR